MSVFEIPVQNIPQSFQISLAGKNYQMTVRWNDAEGGGWLIDFSDTDSGESIASNLAMITGANILEGLEYLGFNGILFCTTDGNQLAVPTLQNLGVEGKLYFDTDVVDG